MGIEGCRVWVLKRIAITSLSPKCSPGAFGEFFGVFFFFFGFNLWLLIIYLVVAYT